MSAKFLFITLLSILLPSCISIRADSTETPPPPKFATVTLRPTTTPRTTSTAPTVQPEAGSLSPVTTTPPNCKNAAVLLRDVTVPDGTRMKAGETFTKTWEFQNMGTCPWVGYSIKYTSGDSMTAPLSAPIPDTPPNEKTQVSVELTAPTADGAYTASFRLNDSAGNNIPVGTENSFWVKIIVGVYVPPTTAAGATPVLSGNCVWGPNPNFVNEIVSLINAERTNAGLPSLIFNAEIASFAQSHAEDMAYNNFLSHDGYYGSFGERMAGYNTTHFDYRIFGEILAIGTPQDAMNQWRRDEHWDFLFYDNTQIGAGYAYNSCSDFGGYFTVDFGY